MTPGFRHQGCSYGSDAEFLAMAVPFVDDGLRRDEPVLVSTTPANLGLLREALGADAGRIVHAEADQFGRRPPRLAEALRRYWTRHRSAAPAGTVRVLAEPARIGEGGAGAAWQRAEAGFEVSLAGTGIWLVCPYDTRIVEAEVIEDARRAHPECWMDGPTEPCPEFTAPDHPAGEVRPGMPFGRPGGEGAGALGWPGGEVPPGLDRSVGEGWPLLGRPAGEGPGALGRPGGEGAGAPGQPGGEGPPALGWPGGEVSSGLDRPVGEGWPLLGWPADEGSAALGHAGGEGTGEGTGAPGRAVGEGWPLPGQPVGEGPAAPGRPGDEGAGAFGRPGGEVSSGLDRPVGEGWPLLGRPADEGAGMPADEGAEALDRLEDEVPAMAALDRLGTEAPGPLGAAADVFRFEGDLVAVRRYVLEKAGTLLRPENAVAMFGIAVGEAFAYLLRHGIDRVAVWVRPAAGRVVCTLHSDRPLDLPPFFGSRPPDNSLWMTEQICEWLDISSDAGGCTIELAMPGPPAAED